MITIESVVDSVARDELVNFAGAELIPPSRMQTTLATVALEQIHRRLGNMIGTLLWIGTLVWSDEWHNE